MTIQQKKEARYIDSNKASTPHKFKWENIYPK